MKIYILIISLFLLNRFTVAQQAMTLKNCEERFIQSNLSLLAEQYNISISKAEVIQAKIWDLPYFSGEINALDPQNNRAFHINNSGQKAFNVQQLIYLGGKKKKEVEFAKSNVTLAELQFEQLLRNLKFQLYDNFYSIYFNNYKIQKINFQIENLDTLINYYSSQEKKGNIPLKDVVRLKSLANSFKGQMIDLQNKVLSYQENLKIILNLENKIEPIISEEDVSKILAKPILQSEEELKKTALLKNPDYLYKTKIIENSDLYLKWQKSINVPDFTLGAGYDQRGGAFVNQVGISFGMSLPTWRKNKGNVLKAESIIEQSKISVKETELELKSKISTSIASLKMEQKNYTDMSTSRDDFDNVYAGILKNFQNRNISLIEFTDFVESYTVNIFSINDLKYNIIMSGETINYLINEKIF